MILRSAFLPSSSLTNGTSSGGGLHEVFALGRVLLVERQAHLDLGVHLYGLLVVGHDDFLGGVEALVLSFCSGTYLGDIVESEHHVLRRHGDRGSVCGVEDVLRTEHQQLGLHDRGVAEREVDRHLVAVEVGVERRTCERVQLDGLSFDHAGLERLDTETVQGRCAVEQHGMSLHHVLEDVPDHGVLAVHDLLCGLHGLHDAALDELADDERLVELCSHELGQTALMHVELGSDHDHGTCGVVHALSEEVLAEASLLSLEGVGERLERPVGLALHRRRLLGVVEQ